MSDVPNPKPDFNGGKRGTGKHKPPGMPRKTQLHKDMVHVSKETADKDTTDLQKQLRQMRENDMPKFIALLEKCNKEHRQAIERARKLYYEYKRDDAEMKFKERAAGGAAVVEEDVGTEKCLELLEELLARKEWREA